MPKFSLAPVAERHLARAPLAKVVTQVQFSRTPQLITDSAEAAIADALGRYPVRRRQLAGGIVPNVVVNGQQLQFPGSVTPGVALAFSDPQGSWLVTITDTAVAMETTAYSSRDDFCERAGEVFSAIAAVAMPPVVDRVGVRYIDRITGEAVEKMPSYALPQLSGLIGCIEPPLVLRHSISESQIEIGPNELMMVKSGQLPAGTAFDPALPPIAEPSWVLDMDVFTTQGGFAFDLQDLDARVRRYAEVVYAFFRFATTDEFEDAFRTAREPVVGEAR